MATPSSQALEAKSQDENRVVITTREAALKFIIDQFENCTEAPLIEVAVKARAAQEKWAQGQQAETADLVEQLRKKLEAILAQEREARYPYIRYHHAYQSLRLLTGFWPGNRPYVPDADESRATAGLPACPICLCGISKGSEVVTSYNYAFHTVCLVGALALKPQVNPMTNLRFSARDMRIIRESATEAGLTVAVPVAPTANTNANRPLPSSFKYVAGFFLLSLVGGMLGALGFFLAPVVCAVGLAGFLGSMAYFFYQLKRETTARARQWTLYQEELALAQAIELSLRPENNPAPAMRTRGMDFLYDRSGQRAAAPTPRPETRSAVIHLPPPAPVPAPPPPPVSTAVTRTAGINTLWTTQPRSLPAESSAAPPLPSVIWHY